MYVALEDTEEVLVVAIVVVAIVVVVEIVIAEVVIARAPVLAILLFRLVRTNVQFNGHKILYSRTRIERCITKKMIFKRTKKYSIG